MPHPHPPPLTPAPLPPSPLPQVVMERVKGAEKLPGVQEILLPGERGQQKVKARHAAGSMPVEANLYARLRAMAGARAR